VTLLVLFILAVIWAIGLLVGAIIAIIRIIKPEKRQASLVAKPIAT
jgi:hypothetical protein